MVMVVYQLHVRIENVGIVRNKGADEIMIYAILMITIVDSK